MAKRSTSVDKILLDALFNIPDGSEEVFTRDKEQPDIDINTIDIDLYEGDSDLGDFPEDSGELDTPEGIRIVSQKIRRAPGGHNVVDIVVEVDDIVGAVNYEIQVTKV